MFFVLEIKSPGGGGIKVVVSTLVCLLVFSRSYDESYLNLSSDKTLDSSPNLRVGRVDGEVNTYI